MGAGIWVGVIWEFEVEEVSRVVGSVPQRQGAHSSSRGGMVCAGVVGLVVVERDVPHRANTVARALPRLQSRLRPPTPPRLPLETHLRTRSHPDTSCLPSD